MIKPQRRPGQFQHRSGHPPFRILFGERDQGTGFLAGEQNRLVPFQDLLDTRSDRNKPRPNVDNEKAGSVPGNQFPVCFFLVRTLLPCAPRITRQDTCSIIHAPTTRSTRLRQRDVLRPNGHTGQFKSRCRPNRRSHGRSRRQVRGFTYSLGAKWCAIFGFFDQRDLDRRHVGEGRNEVVGE